MGKLVKCFSKRVMSYEFRESGLLSALECLLTRSPREVKNLLQKEQAKASGEEYKQSDSMIMKDAKKDKTLSKKEARAYLQRLRLFFHSILKV